MLKIGKKQTRFVYGPDLYSKLIPDDNTFVIIDKKIDFSFANEACKHLYSEDMGRIVSNTPEKMFRAELVQYMAKLTDREAEEQINFNIIYKWFTGYDIDDQVFDHSALTKFRTKLGPELHKTLFQNIIDQLVELGLISKTETQSTDATHVIADAAIPNITRLIRMALKNLLDLIEQDYSEIYDIITKGLKVAFLTDKSNNANNKHRIPPQKARIQLSVIVEGAMIILEKIRQVTDDRFKSDSKINSAIIDLRSILDDNIMENEAVDSAMNKCDASDEESNNLSIEDSIKKTGNANLCQKQDIESKENVNNHSKDKIEVISNPQEQTDSKSAELNIATSNESNTEYKDVKKIMNTNGSSNNTSDASKNSPEQKEEGLKYKVREKKGEDRIVTFVDKDARFGKKSDNKGFMGYKVHTTMTTNDFITNTDVTPGNVTDDKPLVGLLDEQEKANGVKPQKLNGDKAYGTEENRVELSERGIKLVTPIKNNSNSNGKFSRTEFTIDPDNQICICPQGMFAEKMNTNKKTGNSVFHFDEKDCNNCPVKLQCTESDHRTIKVSCNHEMNVNAIVYTETPQFEDDMRDRSGIERKQGQMKSHKMVRARYRGLLKMKIQATLTALAVNMKRLVKIFRGGTPVSKSMS